jgi:hypothetical protein
MLSNKSFVRKTRHGKVVKVCISLSRLLSLVNGEVLEFGVLGFWGFGVNQLVL